MTANRSSKLDDLGNLGASPGSPAWAIAVRIELQIALDRKEVAESHLSTWLRLFQEHQGWRALKDSQGNPFRSWESFCAAPYPFGLGGQGGRGALAPVSEAGHA